MNPHTVILLLWLGTLPSMRAAELIPFGAGDAPPTLIVIDPPPSASVASLNVINITFSENVTGVDASDLLVATNRWVEVLDAMPTTLSTQRIYRLVTPRRP